MKNKKKDILNKIKGTGFKAPENYFNTFEKDLQKKTKRKSAGFTVPDNYFQNFETSFNRYSESSALKSAGFKTPKNYFDNFEVHVKTKENKVVPLYRRSFFKTAVLSVAASVLLFFSISKFNFSNKENITISDTEIESLMKEGIISFNTIEIEDVFSDEDLNLVAADETDEISNYLKYTDIEFLLLEN